MSTSSSVAFSVSELLAQVDRAQVEGALSEAAATRIRQWLVEEPFIPYRERLAEEITAGRWTELDNAYYTVLEFGTGGRRGRMYPVGVNVLNERTIAESAQGLADHVVALKGTNAPRSCAIAFDTRHHSAEFALICARVMAAAGFTVYLVSQPRSTPLLSFAVRHLGCDAGIMITASHNPPADNGFKCYAATGGQVVPPDDKRIIELVNAASTRVIPLAEADDPRIRRVGPELDEAYLQAVLSQSVGTARDLTIVYTPMHGVGDSAVGEALRRAGFTRVEVLESQRAPDGDFPNVPGHIANPEIPRTLDAAIAEAKRIGADLVLASDPDADRIGVGLPIPGDPQGAWTTLTGNQIGALLTAFVLEKTREAGRLKPEQTIVTTLVSTGMARALADRFGVRTEDNLLVGFKWIAVTIDRIGPDNLLFAFEESHGYQKGGHVRDKDAATASLLFAELAADLKAKGIHVLEYLNELYRQVGHYGETQINKVMEGRAGAQAIRNLMTAFRNDPPRSVGGLQVVEVADYHAHEIRPIRDGGPARPLPEPSGDLLIFHLDAPGVRFAVRPSGTEPKIKFYLFARSEVQGDSPQALAAAKERTASLLAAMGRDLDAYVAQAVQDE